MNARLKQAHKDCCVNCSNPNCGRCIHCRGKKIFGGDGRDHQRCVQRQCLRLNPNAPIFHAPASEEEDPSEANRTAPSGSDTSDDDCGLLQSRPCKRNRCMKCPGCMAKDCGKCLRCLGKRKFGGDGSDHQSCLERLCHVLYPTVTPSGRTRERRPRRKRSAEQQPIASAVDLRKKPAKRLTQDDSDQDAMDRPFSIVNGQKDSNEPSGIGTSYKSFFSLTSYLLEEDSKHEQKDYTVALSEPTSMYGQAIRDEPNSNLCAGCLGRRDAELSDDPILLCDGARCGREYHLACCIPTLSSVPDVEEWLCQDCSPDGSTASLIQYLESADQAKAHYLNSGSSGKKSEHSYVEHALQLDMAAFGARRGEQLLTESELEKSAMIHALALCDANRSLARTRGGNERRAALSPGEFIGKPIRLLLVNHTEPRYHTGRIVDYRDVLNVRASSTMSPHHLPSPVSSKLTDKEFLVRFPAGMDDRKTSHYHWIVLEEHAVSIGSTMVWARVATGHWKPAILWLRTTRSLVSMMKSLPTSLDVEVSKTKHKVCALARAFGSAVLAEVNVRDQCVDLFDRNAIDLHMKVSTDNILPFSLAKTELAEQERVRNWRELKQINPMGPAVLSSRDYVSLPELESNTEPSSESLKSKNGSSTIAPIPNIRRGLDRSKLLSLLHQRGFNPTKDMAADLSCDIVPNFDARTIAAVRCDEKPTPHSF
jgi:CXXC zinc finger domain